MQMDILAEEHGRIYGSVTIECAADFVASFSGQSFPCLIWDHRGRLSAVERAAVAKALLEAGCRYAVCGGESPDEVARFFVLNTSFDDHDYRHREKMCRT